jgi:hypothetical protein
VLKLDSRNHCPLIISFFVTYSYFFLLLLLNCVKDSSIAQKFIINCLLLYT